MLHTQIYLITIALEIGGCKSEAHRIHILVDMKQRECIGPPTSQTLGDQIDLDAKRFRILNVL